MMMMLSAMILLLQKTCISEMAFIVIFLGEFGIV